MQTILDMDILRTARRARGMTQGNVARATGISVPTLRALERGEGGLGPLVAVMEVLGLRWDRAFRPGPERQRARSGAGAGGVPRWLMHGSGGESVGAAHEEMNMPSNLQSNMPHQGCVRRAGLD